MPAQAGIQYAEALMEYRNGSDDWIICFRG
jgi:hypothetical protein